MYPGERSPLTPREAQHLVPRRLSGLGRDRTPGGGAEKSSCSGHVSYVQTGALQWVNIVVNVSNDLNKVVCAKRKRLYIIETELQVRDE